MPIVLLDYQKGSSGGGVFLAGTSEGEVEEGLFGFLAIGPPGKQIVVGAGLYGLLNNLPNLWSADYWQGRLETGEEAKEE